MYVSCAGGPESYLPFGGLCGEVYERLQGLDHQCTWLTQLRHGTPPRLLVVVLFLPCLALLAELAVQSLCNQSN